MKNFVPFTLLDDNSFNIAIEEGVNFQNETETKSIVDEKHKWLFDKLNSYFKHHDNTPFLDKNNTDDDCEMYSPKLTVNTTVLMNSKEKNSIRKKLSLYFISISILLNDTLRN